MTALGRTTSEEVPAPGERLVAVPTAERVALIDVVRGFALYGVLLANLIWVTHESVVPPVQLAALPTADVDRFVRIGVEFFVDWKFYTLFSFLFGLSFSLQLTRGERRSAPWLPGYRRRLSILFGLGVLHAYALWYGDILHHYALLGFGLILVRRWSDRWLLGLGAALGVAVPAAVVMATPLLGPVDAGAGTDPAELQMVSARFQAFSSGSYSAALRENARYALGFWTSGFALHFLPAILGKFLLGFYAGRRRLLEEPESHMLLFRRLLTWGLVFGAAGNVLWVVSTALTRSGRVAPSAPWVLASQPVIYLGLAALAAFYLSAIVLLWQRAAWRSRLQHLAPLGQMALTNYLTHSVIYVLVFSGFGLGLLGQVGATFCLALSVLIYVVQVLFSAWWLRQYRFGPAEWLWRSLTYGATQPMRRRISDAIP